MKKLQLIRVHGAKTDTLTLQFDRVISVNEYGRFLDAVGPLIANDPMPMHELDAYIDRTIGWGHVSQRNRKALLKAASPKRPDGPVIKVRPYATVLRALGGWEKLGGREGTCGGTWEKRIAPAYNLWVQLYDDTAHILKLWHPRSDGQRGHEVSGNFHLYFDSPAEMATAIARRILDVRRWTANKHSWVKGKSAKSRVTVRR